MGLLILGVPLLVVVVIVAITVWPSTGAERQAQSDAITRGDYQTAYFAGKEADRKVAKVIGITVGAVVVCAVLYLAANL